MSNISCSIKLDGGSSEISRLILEALMPEVERYLRKVFDKIQIDIRNIIMEAIVAAPEYSSLLSGTLKAEFGLPDSQSRLETILSFWKLIDIEYRNVTTNGNKLSGGFRIGMIQSDYNDVLGSSAAVLVTEKGKDLPWLEWLLLFGDKKIIKNYNVSFGDHKNSRTGMAIMKGSVSGKWGVPSQYSGSANNNWITRAIDSVDSNIEQLISQAI